MQYDILYFFFALPHIPTPLFPHPSSQLQTKRTQTKPTFNQFNQLEQIVSALVGLLHSWVQTASHEDMRRLNEHRALDSYVDTLRFYLGEGLGVGSGVRERFAEVLNGVEERW